MSEGTQRYFLIRWIPAIMTIALILLGLAGCGVEEKSESTVGDSLQDGVDSENHSDDVSKSQIQTADDVWHSYQSLDDLDQYPGLTNMIDFILSRDGQGYHIWIYREISSVIYSYGLEVGYDFTQTCWTAERIYPAGGGFYNAVISQTGDEEDSDMVLDILFQPDERKYVVLYACYEDGDRRAGVNDIPYASQLEWSQIDRESGNVSPLDNPFEEILEVSVCQVIEMPLYQYREETGDGGKWSVREMFGRSPFFDFFLVSDEKLAWFCADIGRWEYTCVVFEIK